MEAGSHARINDDSGGSAILSSDESALLRKFALAKGAFRTLAVHVRLFERFREWVGSVHLQLYPLDLQVLLKYALWLYNRGCGPTVLPSVRAAVSWVARRLRLVLPPLNDAALTAFEEMCISERAKELKEAIAYLMQLVGFTELFVMTRYEDFPVPCLILGWVLRKICASLRFDDAVHVHTDSINFQEEILCGLWWQTKVDGNDAAPSSRWHQSACSRWRRSWSTLLMLDLGSYPFGNFFSDWLRVPETSGCSSSMTSSRSALARSIPA